MPFESPFPSLYFDGSIKAAQYEFPPPAPDPQAPPTSIVRTDQNWCVHVFIENTGIATELISGEFHLHVFLESIGPGQELSLIDPGDHIIPLTPAKSPVKYFAHVDIPAGKVKVGKAGGVFKLVVSLTYFTPSGDPGPIAGYAEPGLVQFYNP